MGNHKTRCHSWFSEKNPFQGGGTRVFMARSPEDQVQSTSPDTSQTKEQKELAELFKSLSVGDDRLSVYFTLDSIWVNLLNIVDDLDNDEKPGDKTAIFERLKAKSAANLEQVNKLRAQNLHISEDTITKLREEVDQDKFRDYMVDAIKEVLDRKYKALEAVELDAVQSADKKLQEAISQWNELPSDFDDVKEEKIAVIEQTRKELPDFLRGLSTLKVTDPIPSKDKGSNQYPDWKRIGMIRQLQREVENVERDLEYRKKLKEKAQTDSQLKERFDAINNKAAHYEQLASRFDEMLTQVESELTQYQDELTAFSKANQDKLSDYKKKELEKELQQADKQIQALKKQKASGPALLSLLDDESFFMEPVLDENGKEKKNPDGTVEMKVSEFVVGPNGEKGPLKRGLKQLLDQLKDRRIDPKKEYLIRYSLDNSLKALEHGLKNMLDDVNDVLPANLRAIKAQRDTLGAIKDGEEGNVTFFQDIMWLSPYDFYQLFAEHIPASARRSFERRAKEKQGMTNEMFKMFEKADWPKWNPFQHLKNISGDLSKMVDSAESESVSFYKDDLKERDRYALFDTLETCRNKDQFKAIIELLAEDGSLDFSDQRLVERFNHFQNKVYVDPQVAAGLDIVQRNQAIETAMGAIWGDYDMFQNLYNQSESAYESRKQKEHARFKAVGRNARKGLGEIKTKILEEKIKHGSLAKVDPALYEVIVAFDLVDGSYEDPAGCLYDIIQGAAAGLITMDRARQLIGELMNDYPSIEIIKDSKIFKPSGMTRFHMEELAKIDGPPHSYEPGNAFYDWYNSTVMSSGKVLDRMQKTMSSGKAFDHDLVWAHLTFADEASIDKRLKTQADGSTLEDTAIKSTILSKLGSMHHMLENYDEINKNSQGNADTILQTAIASYVRFDSILFNRMYAGNTSYKRASNALMNQGPRAGALGVTGMYFDYEGKKIGHYNDEMRALLTKMDKKLFDFVFDTNAATREDLRRISDYVEQTYGYKFSPELTKKDMFYEQFSALISSIITQKHTNFKKFMAQIQSEHRQHWDKQEKDKKGSSLPSQRVEAQSKRVKYKADQGFHVFTQQSGSYVVPEHSTFKA